MQLDPDHPSEPVAGRLVDESTLSRAEIHEHILRADSVSVQASAQEGPARCDVGVLAGRDARELIEAYVFDGLDLRSSRSAVNRC